MLFYFAKHPYREALRNIIKVSKVKWKGLIRVHTPSKRHSQMAYKDRAIHTHQLHTRLYQIYQTKMDHQLYSVNTPESKTKIEVIFDINYLIEL